MGSVFAAFDQGQIPNISCLNLATQPLGVDFNPLIAALQEYINRFVAPVWGTPCNLEITAKIPTGSWAVVFLDDADVANALGYHDLTPDGFPLAKVFVESTKQDGGLVSVTAAHELVEMLVDPGVQMGAFGPKNTWYAYETADAVEQESFEVQGIPLSNFVYPSWFEDFHKPNSIKFDQMALCSRPFEILKGGYMPVYVSGRWTQIFGSAAARKWFKKTRHPRTARRGSRKKLRLSTLRNVGSDILEGLQELA